MNEKGGMTDDLNDERYESIRNQQGWKYHDL